MDITSTVSSCISRGSALIPERILEVNANAIVRDSSVIASEGAITEMNKRMNRRFIVYKVR